MMDWCFGTGCDEHVPGARRARWGFDPAAFFDLRSRGGPWSGKRGGRMFEQGDLKYVILQMLAEKPRHGYDIIKALEERSGGAYAPSPGTVYPTLTMLEDLGYAKVTPEEGGKKIYEITDTGRAYLAENRSTVDDLFERMTQFGSYIFADGMRGVHMAFKDVARATYSHASRHVADADRLKKIVDVLQRAAKEIDEIGR